MNNRNAESQIPPFLPALVLLGIFIGVLALLMPMPSTPPPATTLQPSTTLAPTAIALVPTNLPPAEVVSAYDAAVVAQGQGTFQSICSACHGFDAHGIPGLGKNLIASPFVHGLTDDELLAFIIHGRDPSDPLNTTGVAMPPRGGNPSLTDADLLAVIAYLRTQTEAQTMPAVVVQAAPTASPEVPQGPAILPTSIPVTPQPFSGETAYTWACAGCHGIDGKGNAPFGPGFEASPLLADKAALLAFLTEGRPLVDPRVEFPHPGRGGYPSLTDEQLAELTDYVMGLVNSGAKP